jgi:hypothetical protein
MVVMVVAVWLRRDMCADREGLSEPAAPGSVRAELHIDARRPFNATK